MKYEVKVVQERKYNCSDGTSLNMNEAIMLTFTSDEDLHVFNNLIAQNGENITVEIRFIKEDF